MKTNQTKHWGPDQSRGPSLDCETKRAIGHIADICCRRITTKHVDRKTNKRTKSRQYDEVPLGLLCSLPWMNSVTRTDEKQGIGKSIHTPSRNGRMISEVGFLVAHPRVVRFMVARIEISQWVETVYHCPPPNCPLLLVLASKSTTVTKLFARFAGSQLPSISRITRPSIGPCSRLVIHHGSPEIPSGSPRALG